MLKPCSNLITQEQQQSFQQQINWKHPERTVLKSWAIEAKDYDIGDYCTQVIMLSIPILCSIVMFFLFRENNADWFQWPSIIAFLGVLFPGLWLVLTILNPKKLLVYRFTDVGFEVAGWSRQAENQKKMFIGVGIVCSIIALFIVVLIPQAFILLFIGPGGIVLVTLSQTTNQQAWKLQRDYSQKEFTWSEFTKLMLFDKRSIITFQFDAIERKKKTPYVFLDIFHVFCPQERYQEILDFIVTKLPNIPCTKEHVEIYQSACS